MSTPADIGVTPRPVGAAAAKFKTDSAAGAAKTGLDDVVLAGNFIHAAHRHYRLIPRENRVRST